MTERGRSNHEDEIHELFSSRGMEERGQFIADAILKRKSSVIDDLSDKITQTVATENPNTDEQTPTRFMLDVITLANLHPHKNDPLPDVPQEDSGLFDEIEELQRTLNGKGRDHGGFAKAKELTYKEYSDIAVGVVKSLYAEDNRALSDLQALLPSSQAEKCLLLKGMISVGLKRTFPRVSLSQLAVLIEFKATGGRALGPDEKMPKDMRILAINGLLKTDGSRVELAETGERLLVERYKPSPPEPKSP